MKKVFALLLIAVMLVINCNAAVVEVNIGGIQVNSIKDGEKRTILLEEVPFVNESGRTMVPVRAISESFGASVSWDGEKQEVKIVSGENVILLYIDSNKALLNGNELTLDSAPVIRSGRTFVPLRFIGESFGYNINYVATTKQIIIDDTEIVINGKNAAFSYEELEALYSIYYQTSAAAVVSSGLSEEEHQAYALQKALETATIIVQAYDTFPEAVLEEKDMAEIKSGIEYDEGHFVLPLSGISALMHEKLYFSQGVPALYTIAKSETVKELYENNYVCAKHILVDDIETAEAVLAKIAAGGEFDALIAEYGKDPGMEQNKDGYVFTYGEMIKSFEEASYALEVGSVSLPVESDYGYHIIKREALPEIPDYVMYNLAKEILMNRASEAEVPELLVPAEELLERLSR